MWGGKIDKLGVALVETGQPPEALRQPGPRGLP